MRRLPGTIAAGFQWHDGAPALPYRCGGSTGIAGSTPAHLFPVSPGHRTDITGTTNEIILALAILAIRIPDVDIYNECLILPLSWHDAMLPPLFMLARLKGRK